MKPKVLVVQHEPLSLLAAVDLVEEAGFEALEASNAADAARILETVPEACILFTNIDMPGGMDGLKLAVSARDRWPIIVVSGMKTPRPDELPSRGVFSPNSMTPLLSQGRLWRWLPRETGMRGSWIHLCIDMQRIFGEETPWHVPWKKEVYPQIEELAGRFWERTIFTRVITPRDPVTCPACGAPTMKSGGK